jgi:integrase
VPRIQAVTLPVADVVLEALSAHLAEHGTGDDGLIFTTPDGGPIRRTRFTALWRPVAAGAGLESGVGFHALRHFYASSLIRQGCSVKVVQSHLGHATAAETLDTYSHLWPDDEDRSRAAVDVVLGTSRVHPVSILCPSRVSAERFPWSGGW